ncbi:putative S-adenosyl-L-methionine-dependent methyltransferase protein [Corchorus olitorius]|uniref:S-adenosyl-L-methionine-dependent methyltransferase protein n=1 Tax=Corchorus olitorius TaxID=93759 RepID=A0A1R3GRF5_9ROSI|nr:putative S-adenosyl-L-methionine-dependent methyltransferase protein [Corchorus olitorius]
MAMGKYSRVDGRKSSSYCSTATIVVFVAFCLVGIWMFMSSSVVPLQNSELSSQQTKNEVKQTSLKSVSKQFDDTSGDLPEGSTREDGTTMPNKESEKTDEDNSTENLVIERNNENSESQNSAEENQEENHANESSDEKSESENEPKRVDEDDGNGNGNAGETNAREGESDESSGENSSESTVQNEEHSEQSAQANSIESQEKDQVSNEILPAGAQSEILTESTTQNGSWSTQAVESQNEKQSLQSSMSSEENGHHWKLCKTTAGPDYIPCLDNWQVIKKLPSTKHYEHRERHCPEEPPTCLVPLPDGYKRSIKWPKSRDKIWYYNVPHTKLADVKGHQNWVKVTGEYLTFPGGGTQFKNGALHYIDFIQNSVPEIAWGKRTRVILDVGCGVASFGGYLFERDVLAMSFAPKDEHEAQVQFALERGIPAISSVMGTKRLPYPSSVFDVVHCARCRVPWHIEGGKLLLELNRVLRPGGYFVWSATPVYQKLPEDVGIWEEMSRLTKSMCWDLVTIKKDRLNAVGAAIYRKPTSNECYNKRSKNTPPLCEESDDPNAAWNVPLQACMHKVPVDSTERGSQWPAQWPERVEQPPYWLNSQVGVYGKAAKEDFTADYNHWKTVVSQSYLNGMGINWSSVRNVMDMRAVYGGFAAALKDLKVWVMNVVPIDSPDTLPIIYERGLFGMYHDWCESFSTYPRSYDVLHADHLFSTIKKRCKLDTLLAEVDRILRPEGKLIVRDNGETISELESLAKSLQWEIRMIYSKDNEGLLCVRKTFWRPTEEEAIKSAII